MFSAKNYKLVKKVKHGLDRDESPRRNFHPGTISLFLSPYNGPRTIITSFEGTTMFTRAVVLGVM